MMAILNAINDVMIEGNTFDDYTEISDKTKYLLLNNSCGMSSDKPIIEKVVHVTKGTLIGNSRQNGRYTLSMTYRLHFMLNCTGNERNVFYDMFYGGNQCQDVHLIIFLDHFKSINIGHVPEVDENGIDNIIDNSIIFYQIKKLTELFLVTYYSPIVTSVDFNGTIAGSNFRYTPSLVAGYIINYFNGLTEDDVEGCGIDYNFLMDIIQDENISIGEKLIGIRMKNNVE
jgi:hypothetical protein